MNEQALLWAFDGPCSRMLMAVVFEDGDARRVAESAQADLLKPGARSVPKRPTRTPARPAVKFG